MSFSGSNSHFCASCGSEQKHTPRYPWHLCNDCRELACDAKGRRLAFGNVSFSGGLSWRYADDPTRIDETALSVICHVKRRPVLVSEARFGGIVVQPFQSVLPMTMDPKRVVRLTNAIHIEKAQERLVPVSDKRVGKSRPDGQGRGRS